MAKKNILLSFFLKAINIGISLILVPMTINYVDSDRYGIWLTLSSLISWIAFFDIGVTHGFRNKFVEALAVGDTVLAKKYVSTTYTTLICIFIPVAIILCVINSFLDWGGILNISTAYNTELRQVFGVIIVFFCLNLIAGVMPLMLTADQRPAISACLVTIGQFLSLIFIYVLTKVSTPSILYLSLCFSGIPCLVVIICSFIVFRLKRYRKYTPSIHFVDFSLNKAIIGLGGKFFFISLFIVLIFQFMNIIISRVEGPVQVTNYNIAYKYFSVLLMVSMILLQPFWSSFTDAYAKKDVAWMVSISKKLEKIILITVPIAIVMVLCSDLVYKIWVKDSVQIGLTLTISVAFYVLVSIFANLYMVLINGIGKVYLQMIIYGVAAIVSFPLMTYFCKTGGIELMLVVPSVVYFIQALFGKIQLNKLLKGKAQGVWNK